jgi:hypothetical protein
VSHYLTPPESPGEAVAFGDLLASTVGAVVQAQEQLDEFAIRRREVYETTPPGQLGLPPVSYVFNAVAVELELSASVSGSRYADPAGPALLCRTLNPTMVGLYGYQASAGIRVRLLMEPRGPMQIRPPEVQDTPTP